ncbi:MAG: hypothetical protein H0U73_05860 [Tatlockia sp.]|nr:hypothetical protein [Tatlockia sp.]
MFWKEKNRMVMHDDQFKTLSNHKEVTLRRTFLKAAIQKEIESGKSAYFQKFKPETLRDFGDLVLYPDQVKYSVGNKGLIFNLNTLCTALLKDDEVKLFATLTVLNKAAALFNEEYQTQNQLMDSVDLCEQQLLANNGKDFKYLDLYFIGLLPFIMDTHAVRCFNLFIRAFLTMNIGSNLDQKLESDIKLSIGEVLFMVFSSQSDHFKKEFLYLALVIIPSTNPALYEILKYYSRKKETKIIDTVFKEIKNEKLENIRYVVFNNNLDELAQAIFPMLVLANKCLEFQQHLNFAQKIPGISEDHLLTLQTALNRFLESLEKIPAQQIDSTENNSESVQNFTS